MKKATQPPQVQVRLPQQAPKKPHQKTTSPQAPSPKTKNHYRHR
jgi:hypothetical protein